MTPPDHRPTAPPTVAPASDEEIARIEPNIAKTEWQTCSNCDAGLRSINTRMKCPICNAAVDGGRDEAREVVGELLSALAYVLKHFGVKEGECFTIPNGDCIGTKCMHDVEEGNPSSPRAPSTSQATRHSPLGAAPGACGSNKAIAGGLPNVGTKRPSRVSFATTVAEKVEPATELKPCPFCGEIPTKIEATRSRPAEVLCANMAANCIASRASGYIEQWNTRPIEDGLRARVAELEATLSELETRIFAIGSDSPICQLHRLKLSGLVDFIRAALKPEPR